MVSFRLVGLFFTFEFGYCKDSFLLDLSVFAQRLQENFGFFGCLENFRWQEQWRVSFPRMFLA